MAPKLSIHNAAFGYTPKETVWENINIDIEEGECLCLLGPNGCGKTTLFNCINNNYQLKTGEVLLNGKNVADYKPVELAKTMGIVFQEHSAPFPYTSLEVVRMGRAPYLSTFASPTEKDTEMAYAIMQDLGIEHLAGKRYTQISGGERQLVLIARTLCQQPEMILFDEPTSHLDFKNQAMVLKTVRRLSESGMTVVMTSHSPNHVFKMNAKVVMLGYHGMVAQGSVDEVMTEENLRRTYGVGIKIYDAQSGDMSTRFCDPILD